MKKTILIICLLYSTVIHAQFFDGFPKEDTGNLMGGFGMTWIDGEPHYTVRLTPDVSFGNFGLGLDLNLDFDANGKLRSENFKDAADYLSLIRYFRYGKKGDPAFVKAGAIDLYTLGQGNLMYAYSNSPSFDNRKVGLVVDADFSAFGFESIYSDFSTGGILGVRGYVRPLQFTSLSSIPILKNIEVGASFAHDFNEYAGITGVKSIVPQGNQAVIEFNTDGGARSAFGLDIALPVIKTDILRVTPYANFTKILDNGSGAATGIKLDFEGLGLVNATVLFERRFNGENYIPAYFSSLYELERFSYNQQNGQLTSKAAMLKGMPKADNGIFGSLYVGVLGLFDIIGSYQRLDKTPNSGMLHIASNILPEDAPVVLRFGYDKIHIRDDKDIFTFDDRSHFYSEAGYKPMPYLIVSIVYHWTFAPLRDADDTVIGYEPQKRIEPRVSFVYPFNF